MKNYKKGVSNFQNGWYEQAILEFLKVREIDQTLKGQHQLYIAESYRLSNRYLESLPYYEKALEFGVNTDDAFFYYAYALKANEDYTLARENFQKFLNRKSTNKVLVERANREITTLQVLSSINTKVSDVKFNSLSEVNTSSIEFGGVVQGGYLVFSAAKKQKIYANAQPYLGIYKIKLSSEMKPTGSVELFSSAIEDPDRNEASPTFSPDGKVLVFAKGNSGKKKDNLKNVDLYLSRLVPNEGWSEPILVSASDSLAWDGSPAFSKDGKTLYFSSDRAGGSGGLDVYRVTMDASGRFSTPVNMGKAINTAGDEMFPFVTEDGKLYFSSDGHPGLGKLDLFVATRSDGKINVENLGIPFNSSLDDFGIFLDSKGNMTYSSNRSGGQGNDDIYYYFPPITEDQKDPTTTTVVKTDTPPIVKEKRIINYFLAGTIQSKSQNTFVNLDSATIKIFKLEAGIEDLVTELKSTGKGYGPFALTEDTDYSLLVEKDGYLSKRVGFSMYGRKIPELLLKKPVTDTVFYENVVLDNIFIGKTFQLENIYYDLDKWDIREDAALELDKLVQILKDNPKISIELGSHTDTRASDSYNQRLSQKRADSAIKYIISKGIAGERLNAKGYGESELIIKSAKNEEEHQVNRRTEFKVVDIGEKI
ncbi:MAG: OmpA family protein [Leadbetterella sp.]